MRAQIARLSLSMLGNFPPAIRVDYRPSSIQQLMSNRAPTANSRSMQSSIYTCVPPGFFEEVGDVLRQLAIFFKSALIEGDPLLFIFFFS